MITLIPIGVSMDDLINIFVETNFTPEGAEDFYQALGLLRLYNYLDPFVLIDDVLMTESFKDTGEIKDTITLLVKQGQAYILDQHGIVLTDDATLAFNNTVLKTLYQLQKLEDPVPVLRILECSEPDDIKYAQIMEMFTNINYMTFLQVIDSIRPVFIKNLGMYLYAEEEAKGEALREMPLIRDTLRLYKEVFGINPAVRVILDCGTVYGEEFELYLPLYNELREVLTDEKVLVETLFFMLLFSSDGVHDPMGVFNKYADHLVSDLTIANRLGRTIGELSNKMTRFKEKKIEEV